MRACGGEGELYTFENRGEAQHVSSLPSAGALSGEGDREGGKRVRRGAGGTYGRTMKLRQFLTCCPERFLKQTLFGKIIDVVFSAPLRLQS